MKNINVVKAFTIFSILMFVQLIFSSCKNPIPRPVQIEGNSFILAIGIDKGIDNPENVRLTVLSPMTDSSSGKGGQQEPMKSEVHTIEGRTVFEATRKLKALHHKNYFWGHVRYVLIGQEVARENIISSLDLLARDHEIRLNMLVFVTKGTPAEEILNLGDKLNLFVPDVLRGLVENIKGMSLSKEVKLSNIISTLDNPYMEAYLPSISVLNRDKTYISLNGFAIFKGVQLIDFISDETARGLNWITGDISSGTVVLESEQEKDVSLEIIDSSSKVKSWFVNGNPIVTINISTSANINEQESQENIYTETQIAKLENGFRKQVYKEIKSIIEFARSNNVDILGVSDELYHKHPLKWEKIKTNWKTIFPNIKININVITKINRTYHLREPIGSDRSE